MSAKQKYKPLGGVDDMAPIQDWFIAIYHFLWGGICDTFARIKHWFGGFVDAPFEEFPHGEKPPEDRPDAGLAVILHGYRASTNKFAAQRELIAEAVCEHYPVVYSPLMTYQHNGPLRRVAVEVFDTVLRYAEAHPDAPILIIGISAGGRVGWMLEQELRKHNNHVHLVTIGTPLHGTSVTYVWPWLARKTCGEDLFRHFHPESDSHDLLHRDNDQRPAHHSLFHFSSRTDWVVFPPHRCVSDPSLHTSVTRCSHNHLQTHPEILSYLRGVRPGERERNLLCLTEQNIEK